MPPSSSTSALPSLYQPGLAWFTTLAGLWVFVLILLGAFTTSIGAGMIFPDWPLSNGSLNPDGWLTDRAMFAEHAHRLSAAIMAFLTFAIAWWVSKTEPRPWVRHLAWAALGLVLAQAVLGGLRVVLDQLHVEIINTNLGRLFAMAHATLAQIYVCLLLGVALALSKSWINGAISSRPAAWRHLAMACFALLVLQLAVAAVMRHSFAGLAILSFPLSSPDGHLLPPQWDFRIGIHFAHRVLAVIITFALLALAYRVWRDPATSNGPKRACLATLFLLAVQIALGAASVLTYRNAYYTTAHVIVGATLLALTFGLACWAYRHHPAPDLDASHEPDLSLRRA